MQSGAPRGAYPIGSFKAKQNSRKIEAGDVRLTKKKMKIMTDGPKGALRNASGKFVHGKRGVGYGYNSLEASEEAQRQSVEFEFASSKEACHTASVTGVVIDALNLLLISASLDGTLRFWSFSTQSLSLGNEVSREWAVADLKTPISMLEMVRDAGLVACGCDDRSVKVFDVETRRLVRRLCGNQTSPFTDMAFSPDARRLYGNTSPPPLLLLTYLLTSVFVNSICVVVFLVIIINFIHVIIHVYIYACM
jgi:WD40 repeat protein